MDYITGISWRLFVINGCCWMVNKPLMLCESKVSCFLSGTAFGFEGLSVRPISAQNVPTLYYIIAHHSDPQVPALVYTESHWLFHQLETGAVFCLRLTSFLLAEQSSIAKLCHYLFAPAVLHYCKTWICRCCLEQHILPQNHYSVALLLCSCCAAAAGAQPIWHQKRMDIFFRLKWRMESKKRRVWNKTHACGGMRTKIEANQI